MTTEARRIDLRGDPEADLSDVVDHLRSGGLVAYPTETVYGLGCLCEPDAVAELQSLKGRDPGKPLIVLVESPAAVSDLAWTEEARELAEIFWPGPLTLVLGDPGGIFPEGVGRPEDGAVGVRVSPHPLVARLLRALGEPITSTSLNAPGATPARSGTEAMEVVGNLGAGDVIVIDAGTLEPSGPSTVIDCSGRQPVVLREGTVPTARIRCAIPEIHGKDHP